MTDSAAGASGKGAGVTALAILVVSLFFIWGGVTSLNDVLVPKLKALFQLNYAQAMLIKFAFFTAYFVVSVPAGALVSRVGYGRGMAAGLAIMAAGCAIFFPAAETATYGLFLGALFVLAAGITILQVAANPLIDRLGPARTASSRLTFAQAFNSFGTTIMPYIGARLILGSAAGATPPADLAVRAREAAVIGHDYLGLAALLAVVALVFWAARARLGSAGRSVGFAGSLALLKRPRLGFGVLAIFLYVGAEVTIGSMLTNFLMQPTTMDLGQQAAGERISLYWGGAMVGRFIGSAILRVAPPGKVLAAAAAGAGAAALIASSIHGPAAGWALIAVGLMNSIMFPTIFSLALEGLGSRTPQGSGLLCMAIVGGAVVPLIGGAVADAASLAVALMVPVVCYAMIAAFGWMSRRAAEPLPEISAQAPSIL